MYYLFEKLIINMPKYFFHRKLDNYEIKYILQAEHMEKRVIVTLYNNFIEKFPDKKFIVLKKIL